jgi:predicted nucleotidyltransferase
MSVTGGLEGAVLEVLSGSLTPLSLGAIHRLAATASKSGLRKAILRLTMNGIVDQVPGGYLLNREHLALPAVMELASIRSTLLDRISNEVRSWNVPVELCGVFGSFARRDGDETSDIDLLVIAEDLPEDAIGRLSDRVQRWTGNACHVVVLTAQELEKVKTKREPILDSWRQDLVVLSGERSIIGVIEST